MTQSPIHYLFLYTRLPGYFVWCIRHLIAQSPLGSKAIIVCYPEDNNAPYRFNLVEEQIEIIAKKDIGKIDLTAFKPHLVYVAGWGDKEYNKLAIAFRKTIPVVIGIDNPWKGVLRQRLATVVASSFLNKRCSHLWVTGYPQYEFARRLGFPPEKIIKGLYCVDIDRYSQPLANPNKRIIYVGRMVGYKRPDWLLEGFAKLTKDYSYFKDWELVMVGIGPMLESLKKIYGEMTNIQFMDFKQPDELIKFYTSSSVFCMPSHLEHWGVVVQEAAASGLPLLLSDTCGAASEFLVHGYNGFVFKSSDKQSFMKNLKRIMELPSNELEQMRRNSRKMASRLTLDYWVANLKSILFHDQA